MSNKALKIVSSIVLVLYIVITLYFIYQMYTLGFSYPELGVMIIVCILFGYFTSDVIYKRSTTVIQKVLATIILVLIGTILISSITVFLPWIKEFFVL